MTKPDAPRTRLAPRRRSACSSQPRPRPCSRCEEGQQLIIIITNQPLDSPRLFPAAALPCFFYSAGLFPQGAARTPVRGKSTLLALARLISYCVATTTGFPKSNCSQLPAAGEELCQKDAGSSSNASCAARPRRADDAEAVPPPPGGWAPGAAPAEEEAGGEEVGGGADRAVVAAGGEETGGGAPPFCCCCCACGGFGWAATWRMLLLLHARNSKAAPIVATVFCREAASCLLLGIMLCPAGWRLRPLACLRLAGWLVPAGAARVKRLTVSRLPPLSVRHDRR